MERTCLICGTIIQRVLRGPKKYCSDPCRRTKDRERYRARARVKNMRRRAYIAEYKRRPSSRERVRQKRLANIEAYRQKEREREKKRSRDYLQAKGQRRRARVRAVPRTLTAVQWSAIKQAYRQCCAYCGIRTRRLTIDHVTPLISGGAHMAANIVPACLSCNSRKGAGPPPSIPARRLLL